MPKSTRKPSAMGKNWGGGGGGGGRGGRGCGGGGGSVFSPVLSFRVILKDVGAPPLSPVTLRRFALKASGLQGSKDCFGDFPGLVLIGSGNNGKKMETTIYLGFDV